MSRLDVLIQRMTAQQQCLNFLIGKLASEDHDGKICVELGLGSGRTYDHLREGLPGLPIYVFDYKVECHKSCEPPAEFAVLGAIEETLPPFTEKFAGLAKLIHCDVGSTDRDRDVKLYAYLAEYVRKLAHPGTLIASDRPFTGDWLTPLEVPPGSGQWPYYLYSVN